MAEHDQTENGAGRISYTVRELLAEIKATLSNIDSKLDSKAEKAVVENLEKRLSVMETTRSAELPFANQIINEFRELQKSHIAVRDDVQVLKTNKKDKETFDMKWIPIIASLIGTLILAFVTIHK